MKCRKKRVIVAQTEAIVYSGAANSGKAQTARRKRDFAY